jgi:hypothetical protein
MIRQRHLRLAGLGLRILFPTRTEARYARLIRQSGLFDRAWYLACNPRLPWICRRLPERHYVLVGEAVGLCPSPAFSPRAYSHLNPDAAASGLPPLAHYITTGRAAARVALDQPLGAAAPALPDLATPPTPLVRAPLAVVLHLYYREMWPEMAARLRRLPGQADLFVTLTEDPQDPDAAIRARILADWPTAQIWTFPNLGRDILPFLHLLHSGRLAPYPAVCKLHTKRSPHREDGPAWRQALLDGVIGPPEITAARLEAFLADPVAGLWVADDHLVRGAQWWGPNRRRALELLARSGVQADPDRLGFAAGSIYWARPAALAALAALPVGAADFEAEMGQVDGTTAHALERLSGLLIEAAGLQIRQGADLDAAIRAERPG